MVPGYSFRLKARHDILCDICEYVADGSQLKCPVEEWNYPSYEVRSPAIARRGVACHPAA